MKSPVVDHEVKAAMPQEQPQRVFGPCMYRTLDGQALFTFQYAERSDGRWEIDIIAQPTYGTHDTALCTTYRLPSARGGFRINIVHGHEPRDVKDAKAISAEWSESTHAYILTGRTITDQVLAPVSGGSTNRR